MVTQRDAVPNEKLVDWNTIEEIMAAICNRNGSISQLSRYVRLDKLYEVCVSLNSSANL